MTEEGLEEKLGGVLKYKLMGIGSVCGFIGGGVYAAATGDDTFQKIMYDVGSASGAGAGLGYSIGLIKNVWDYIIDSM